MTTFVKESAENVDSGLTNMKTAMINDYVTWINAANKYCGGHGLNDSTKRMIARYKDNYTITYGKKYIKITERGGSVKAFIVNTDNDKKFKMGDILKPAGWSSPARNYVRGNILKGGYSINWTGPL
jgi:hypothetical protein